MRGASKAGATALGIKVDLTRPGRDTHFPPGKPYGKRQKDAIEALDTHEIPTNYRKTRASPAMYEALHKLALHPKAVASFNANPKRFVSSFIDLTPNEARVLQQGHAGALRKLLKADPTDVAKQFVQAVLRRATLATGYAAVNKANQRNPNGKAQIAAWLASQGYNCTPDDVWVAYQAIMNVDLSVYDNQYSTQLDGAPGPTLLIDQGKVSINGTIIKDPTYASSTLSWTSADGNASTATLHLQIITSQDGKPLPAESYIKPQFSGIYYRAGQSKPSESNFFGKVDPVPNASSATGSHISTWFNTYTTYLRDADDKLQEDSTLIVADAGSGNVSVTYKGATINNFTYQNEILSWSTEDGNAQFVSLVFYKNTDQTTSGEPQLCGKLWMVDGQVPLSPNLSGQVSESGGDPEKAFRLPMGTIYWKIQRVTFAFGTAVLLLGHASIRFIDAFITWTLNPTQEKLDALQEAEKAVDQTGRQQSAMMDAVVEADAVGEGASEPEPELLEEVPQEEFDWDEEDDYEEEDEEE